MGDKVKILIIGFAKIKYMPYMNFYLDNIDREKNDVHIIYWNRDLQEENLDFLKDVTLHEFKCYQEDDVAKSSIIGGFIIFRKFAKSVIKNGNFDFIFILHSLPGVLTYDILKGNFKNKFIFDYRDSTYEGFLPYKKIIGGLVKNSYCTFVSSDAFRVFLPESENNKIYTSHNILVDSLNQRDDKEKFGTTSDKIRIAFWGFIRHEEINLEIIRKVSKDKRFELHYYGREQQVAKNLKKYVVDNNIENVFFHGEYKPEDRYEFVKSTDIIHNIYKDDNMMLAMGNKYYDGAIFKIPQICMEGSFMGKTATENGIGFECDPYKDSFTDDIYNCYTTLDKKTFIKKCDEDVSRFLSEYKTGCKILKNI